MTIRLSLHASNLAEEPWQEKVPNFVKSPVKEPWQEKVPNFVKSSVCRESMKIHCFSSVQKRPAVDAMVVCFIKKNESDVEALTDDASVIAACMPPIRCGDFTAKHGSFVSVYMDGCPEKQYILLGIDERLSDEKIREAFSKVFLSFAKRSICSVAIFPPNEDEDTLKAVLEGVFLGSYRFNRYRSENHQKIVEDVFVLCKQKKIFTAIEEDVRCRIGSVHKAQDLVNMNADEATPEKIAQEIASYANKDMEVVVHDEQWIKKQKMGLFDAVSKGAFHPPRLVVMRYTGAPDSSDRTVFIGKGITFDTGGLDIKTSDSMQTMKSDMAGAAAVAAAMLAIDALKLSCNVTAVIPLCENSIGSRAYKPGDVFTSKKGLTVEIGNTDAEGRLILADAITYAIEKEKPSRLIDVATLTGAADIALGPQISALFSNADVVAASLEKAAASVGEVLWRMPLRLEYEEMLQSDIADCKNVGGRPAGAITAALFLHKFVDNLPWAHIDIAGAAFAKEAHTCFAKGATGVMVRTLIRFMQNFS